MENDFLSDNPAIDLSFLNLGDIVQPRVDNSALINDLMEEQSQILLRKFVLIELEQELLSSAIDIAVVDGQEVDALQIADLIQ